MRPEAAPSEGTPWAHGPGRPKDIPETAVILNQRIITRESLDSSVPAALKLKKRIKRFALDNEPRAAVGGCSCSAPLPNSSRQHASGACDSPATGHGRKRSPT
ncbi:hypothetical protein [Streptomyces mirabilis]|uniref:hypothetical protein n=1 Tax=Streptomyces mirabilis TaxID=68239 RepID=UPI0033BE33BB